MNIPCQPWTQLENPGYTLLEKMHPVRQSVVRGQGRKPAGRLIHFLEGKFERPEMHGDELRRPQVLERLDRLVVELADPGRLDDDDLRQPARFESEPGGVRRMYLDAGFRHMPREIPRMPSQRLRPALPNITLIWSGFPT